MLEIIGIIALLIGIRIVFVLFFKGVGVGVGVATEGVKSAVTGRDFDLDKALAISEWENLFGAISAGPIDINDQVADFLHPAGEYQLGARGPAEIDFAAVALV